MATVGIGRDKAGAGDAIAKDATAVAAARTSTFDHSGGAAPNKAEVATFGQLLVGQIPSEALLAYTTLLALFSTGGSSYKTGRWILYFAALVVCAATVVSGYFAKRDYAFVEKADPQAVPPRSMYTGRPARTWNRHHYPILPTATSVSSMAVYGLTVPGSPLQFEMSGASFGIWAGCLAVGGGVMMSMFTPFLGKGNGAITVEKAPVARSQPANP